MPISTVVQLKATADAARVTAALSNWLGSVYNVPLESAEHEHLIVEWRELEGVDFCCHLVASNSLDETRRTVTVIGDGAGVLAIVEEAPLATVDGRQGTIDLSEPINLLLRALSPLTYNFCQLDRGVCHNLERVESNRLLSALGEDFAPGLVLAITPRTDDTPSLAQAKLINALTGIAVVGSASANAPILDDLSISPPPRPGSVVSVSRTTAGLDTHVVASTSLRTKPDSARRLIVRRQLSTPIPFNTERRRSAAISRLLASGREIDLPAALQLLDDENQRANQLGNRVAELQTLLELAYEEQDRALGELDGAHSQVRYLQRAFRELGEVPIVEPGEDDDWQPNSCLDALVAARDLLDYLVVGASDGPCAALDVQQKGSIWGKKIWSSLRALNDYARNKANDTFAGDIAMYRANTPDGSIPLLADYAATESRSTNAEDNLRAIRTFNVTKAISSSGRIYMEQHVKVDRGGQSAPRIHIYDDSGGVTQRLYIGYIGPHLPTSSGF